MKRRLALWLLALAGALVGASCATLHIPWDVSDGPFTVQIIEEEEKR